MTYTSRQVEVLSFICTFRRKNNYSPTLAEIGSGLAISKITVFGHVTALEAKGAVSRRSNEARSLEVVDEEFRESLEGGMEAKIKRLEEEVWRLRNEIKSLKVNA